MEPDLIIHKFSWNKRGGFNGVNDGYRKFLNNEVLSSRTDNSCFGSKFNFVYFSQLVIAIFIIFTIYILYMRYQTKLTQKEKDKLIIELYNKVQKNT